MKLLTISLAFAVPVTCFISVPDHDRNHHDYLSWRRTTEESSSSSSSSAPLSPSSLSATPAAMEPAKRLLVAGAAAIGAAVGSIALRGQGTKATLDAIDEAFPGTLTNQELVDRVSQKLQTQFGYTRPKTLLCTSLCGDEVARVLEKDFTHNSKYYQKANHFRLGGLAGFPWGGLTAFAEMASHIPDGGSVLIVYAPHVGVDEYGNMGTVPRKGREYGGPCCESAVAAADYVASAPLADSSSSGCGSSSPLPTSPKDAEQVLVSNALLPFAKLLKQSTDKQVEIPYALYEAQKSIMADLIQQGCGATVDANVANIAVLGGIQINTPPGVTDYFLPLSFQVYNNKGELVDDLNL